MRRHSAWSLPKAFGYVTFMHVERTDYMRLPFDLVFSIYPPFAVAVIIRSLLNVWHAIAVIPATSIRSRPPQPMIAFDPFTLTIVLIATLALFGQSIGIAMLCGTIVYLGLRHFDTSIAAETLLQGLFNGYTLLAIPLFILAADIMNIGTLADRLLRFSQALVGRFRGGLGHVNVVASLIFSGMSGSAVADAVGMGRIIINLMTKDGKYTPSYAAAITAASATIGPIIPPSIPMVLYALVSDTSIGYLFAGGILPGLLMGVMLMAMNTVLRTGAICLPTKRSRWSKSRRLRYAPSQRSCCRSSCSAESTAAS